MEKSLKIALGSCKRLQKEVVLYGDEAKKQAEKIESLRAAGTDEYTVRKQEEVLEETRRMIPDCQKRLQLAVENLEKLVKQAREAEDDVLLTQAFAEGEAFIKSYA